MAGAFTHFIVSDFAKRNNTLPTDLYQMLNLYSQFLLYGSVSPDIPYLSLEKGHTNWADLMHYEHTNRIVELGYDELRMKSPNWVKSDWISYIWLMGYVSHIVTDVTIHPIVESIVGPYSRNKTKHRECEMMQDSLIFKEKKNIEVPYSEFIDLIHLCNKKRANFNVLVDFWEKHALGAYPSEKNLDPKSWYLTYTRALDTIDGSNVAAFFRHLGIGKNFTYESTDYITSNKKPEKEKYYDNVKLPNGNYGTFIDDGFNKAVTNVVDAWEKLFNGLKNAFLISEVLKEWNLDTGIDKATNTITYWS